MDIREGSSLSPVYHHNSHVVVIQIIQTLQKLMAKKVPFNNMEVIFVMYIKQGKGKMSKTLIMDPH